MIRTLRPALVAALALAAMTLALLAGPQTAHAAAVDLRSDLVAPQGNVTLGDLFENAGPASQVVVATGGSEGGSLILSAHEVQRLAAVNGLEWANSRNLNRLIARVEFGAPRSSGGRRAVVTGEVLVYTRDFAAGEVIGPQDLVWAAPSGYGAPLDAPRDSRGVIGQAVRRPIRAGTSVSLGDLTVPKVIKKDDMVQVAYSAGGIRLVLQGKAMGDAALGGVVDVMNPSSKKVIQAVASGSDEAVVGPEAERVKAVVAANPRQFASLN